MQASIVPLAIASRDLDSRRLGPGLRRQIFSPALRDGETQVIRRVTSMSANCAPLFQGIEVIDVFEGSAPAEVTLSHAPGMVRTSMAGHDCPDRA